MDWFSAYQPLRAQYWPPVEQFFGNLPPFLHRQATLLKNNLAISCSDTGQLADILCRPADHPLLYLHFWLLDDWQLDRPDVAGQLLPAMALSFAGVFLQNSLNTETSPFSQNAGPLAQLIFQQANHHLARLFPAEAPFWDAQRACWQEYAETALAAESDPAAESLLAGRWAFAKISAAAVAHVAGRATVWPQLAAMLNDFNQAYQVQQDILSLRRDLPRRRLTYPIAQIMAAAGLDPLQPVEPARVLGAAVLTGAVTQLCQADAARLAACRSAAEQLGLPTVARYLAAAAEFVQQTGAMFALKPQKPATPRHFAPPVDTLAVAIAAAEGYLLADETFRESWDVQRGSGPELTAKAFPSGLALEALARAGRPLPAQVAGVFAQLAAAGFRYFNLPELPPDADDLGLLLRLFRYLPDDARPACRQLLAEPLRRMVAGILPTGEIPVWFGAAESAALVWGRSCAATEINLLLGLLDFDLPAYRAVIAASARSVFQRFQTYGLGAALYYVTPYVVWSAFELLARLRQTDLDVELAQTEAFFAARFQQEINQPYVSPQSAAFFTLTAAGPDHRVARWRAKLLKTQRPDGGWPAEPLFLTPHGDQTAWYASRTVTTAFCYLALQELQQRE